MNFRKIDLLAGWFSFLVAFIVYGVTAEPTTSFWDCGEFIASAFKLQVGHPPGAPLFAMMGRMFTMLAPDTSLVAFMANLFSAGASALTIALLFWTITAFVRKYFQKVDNVKDVIWDNAKTIAAIGSGLVGALAYTFTDSFWFSAVEGEVYATSSLITAVTFWAAMRWDKVADEPHADRWLVLIAYITGLSIGVHLLNLLTIPAVGFIYYFRKYNPKPLGTIIALAVSFVILVFIQYGIIPGTIQLAASFEKTFVNGMSMPFGSGFAIYVILFLVIIAGLLFYTQKTGRRIFHMAVWSVFFIVVGYSSYSMILIRSLANPPMDENNPENVFSLVSYLNREQYGSRPLFSGQYYDAKPVRTVNDGSIFIKSYQVVDGKKPVGDFTILKDAQDYIEKNGGGLKIRHRYVKTDNKIKYQYDPNRSTVFPRMWSGEGRHRRAYESWGGVKPGGVPNFSNNMTFFFNYQINWMYVRYFMWNFAGRENDIQGVGNALDGHWISGYSFVDSKSTGVSQSNIPRYYKENKGRNKYYFLPLVLGLVGLVFQFRFNARSAVVVFTLFFMTGLAIVIYLNQPPIEPRERDYTYAGSFYAFAIWIGLAVLALYEYSKRKDNKDWYAAGIGAGVGLLLLLINGSSPWGGTILVCSVLYALLLLMAKGLGLLRNSGAVAPLVITLVCTICAPIILASQNWDDHNRSKRYTARDFAYNYLASCAPNAILFTNGDNDTFPLWYLQEVEGVRTDVRIVNLSLLNTDWYITQMKRKAYENGYPVPFSLSEPLYRQGQRDAVLLLDQSPVYYTMKEHLAFMSRTDGSNVEQNMGLKYFQSNKFVLPVDSAKAVQNGLVPADKMNSLEKELRFEIPGPKDARRAHVVYLNTLMILDLLANFDWERPVYFSMTVGSEYYDFLAPYLQLEGLGYKLVPYKVAGSLLSEDKVNTAVMYEKLMNEFKWGNFNGKGVYLDETNTRMVTQFKLLFIQLAGKLAKEKQNGKAKEVLDRMTELMPDNIIPYEKVDYNTVRIYTMIGDYQKAEETANTLLERTTEMVDYLSQMQNDRSLTPLLQENIQLRDAVKELLEIIKITRETGRNPLDQPQQQPLINENGDSMPPAESDTVRK